MGSIHSEALTDKIRFEDTGYFEAKNSTQAALALVADALSEDAYRNYIPSRTDFEHAFRKLNLLQEGAPFGSDQETWEKLYQGILENHLNSLWISAQAPWASDLLPFLEDPQKNPEIFQAAFLWLSDQLRASADGIKIKPRLVPNGIDGGLVYTQMWEPEKSNGQTLVLIPGDAANVFLYSEMASYLARQGYSVLVMDQPAGNYSEGYQLPNGTRTTGWGDTASQPYLKAMGAALDSTLKAWDLLSKGSSFVLVPHSGGLLSCLAWLRGFKSSPPASLKGIIELAGGWKLAPSNSARSTPALKPFNLPFSRFFFLNGMRGTNGTDAASLERSIHFFLAAEPELHTGHLRSEVLWGAGKGPYAQALKGLKITTPWSAMVSLDDEKYVDPDGLTEGLGAYHWGPGSAIRVLPIGNDCELNTPCQSRLGELSGKVIQKKWTMLPLIQGESGHFLNVSQTAWEGVNKEAGRLFGPQKGH